MDKITGNYLIQANRDFPLDCETLEALQGNVVLGDILGNIGGDRIILRGCVQEEAGAHVSEGYVFIRTIDFPNGEILRFEGGDTSSGVYVRKEDMEVSAMGYRYPKAYTRRSLACGSGQEMFEWEEFRPVTDTASLAAALADVAEELRGKIAGLTRSPLGVVELWAGQGVPEGYALCDGRAMLITSYPELYKTIGSAFNACANPNGIPYTTPEGYFRLPDLRGRFVVGFHDSDNDYLANGMSGGEKQHYLTEREMPVHVHNMKDYYYAESYSNKGLDYDRVDVNSNLGSKSSDWDNKNLLYYRHGTESSGGGGAHENRPPYYVMAYIMRLK